MTIPQLSNNVYREKGFSIKVYYQSSIAITYMNNVSWHTVRYIYD